MATISREEVAHLARLARLAVTDEELDVFAGQLDVILGAVARPGAAGPDRRAAGGDRPLCGGAFPRTCQPGHKQKTWGALGLSGGVVTETDMFRSLGV